MAAQFVDALIGYKYYLKMRGKTSIDEVNNFLIKQSRRPISIRTYSHYYKLLSYGFRNYIPINQFDVSRTLGKIQMSSERRKFEREKVSIPIKFSHDGRDWVNGKILNQSVVGFGLITYEIIKIERGDLIIIRIDGFMDIPAIIVWYKYDLNITALGIRAFEFISKYQSTISEKISDQPTSNLIISRIEKDSTSWSDLFRILEKIDEFIGSFTALFQTFNETFLTNVSIINPIISEIKFGSPGKVVLKIDPGMADLAKVVIEKAQFWSLEKKKFRAENSKKDLENLNLQIEVMRNAVGFIKELKESGIPDEIIISMLGPIKKIFNLEKLPDGIFDDGSPEKAILKARILPSAAELIAGDDTDFEISISK